MGAPVPPEVATYPARAHGMKHWVEWTVDAKPSQYHAIWKYKDAASEDIGLSKVTVSPGALISICGREPTDAEDLFRDLVELYEEGKTADELLAWLAGKCASKLLAFYWTSHVPMPEVP